MILVIKFALLLLSTIVGYTLGYILTETKYKLPDYGIFNFQGLKCRPCLSFHLAWITATFVALSFEDWIMLVVGVLFAFALFTGLKIDQKNKTISLKDYDKFI